jgi:hypothetical protein
LLLLFDDIFIAQLTTNDTPAIGSYVQISIQPVVLIRAELADAEPFHAKE